MLTAPELRVAWLIACEFYLDIEMSGCAIFDLAILPAGIDRVASLDSAGRVVCFPVREYGRFRLAYDENENMLYVGRV